MFVYIPKCKGFRHQKVLLGISQLLQRASWARLRIMFFTPCSNIRPLEGFKQYRHIDMFAFFFYEVTLADTKRLDEEGEGKHGGREEHWIITVEVQRRDIQS